MDNITKSVLSVGIQGIKGIPLEGVAFVSFLKKGNNVIQDHPLLDLVICPKTKSELKFIQLENGAGLLSKKDGVLYPIINDVIIMKPVSQQVKELCSDFFELNESSLSSMSLEYNSELTRDVLDYGSKPEELDWHEKEMTFWENIYKKRLEEEDSGATNWDRSLPRGELLSRLPEGLNKKKFFEIGCGSTYTLTDLYGKDIPNYIGLDLSYYACLLAQKKFPDALFIQGSAENPPLKENSIDVVVAYGVFHHLPGHEENISHIMPIVKPRGFIIGADPLLKPQIPRPRFLDRTKADINNNADGQHEIVMEIGNSPHNEWIDWENLLKVIDNDAFVCESLFEYGVLRHLMIRIFQNRFKVRNKNLMKFIIFIDRLWLATIGKISRSLGPAAVHYAIQKNDI